MSDSLASNSLSVGKGAKSGREVQREADCAACMGSVLCKLLHLPTAHCWRERLMLLLTAVAGEGVFICTYVLDP